MCSSDDLQQRAVALLKVMQWEPPTFRGGTDEDVKKWLHLIKSGCEIHAIPIDLWPFVGRHSLGEVQMNCIVQFERSWAELAQDSEFHWNWDAFVVAMIATVQDAPTVQRSPAHAGENDSTERPHSEFIGTAWKQTNKLVNEHPNAARALGAILIAASVPIIVPAVSVGALNVIGFSSVGPVAGSLATWIQAAYYGSTVASGSLFAGAQAAAMGGITVASAPVQAVATASMTTGIWSWWRGTRTGRQETSASAPATDETQIPSTDSETSKGSHKKSEL